MHPKPHPWITPPNEPHLTIHLPEWVSARARILRLPDPRDREHYILFFNHLEAGWSIIRPLQVAVEPGLFSADFDRDDVTAFVYVDITDRFRDIVGRCVSLVPGVAGEYGADNPTGDLEPELEQTARNLRLLAALEAGWENFPPHFRGMSGPAADAFTAWCEEVKHKARYVMDMVDAATAD